ncbi:MAG: phytoene desaturase family protein [Gordonia sp. (in: high G+C Gram-positive bacteria)]
MSGPRRVVVAGGGVAGLATAALLAADGHEVDLVEQRAELGGRVGSWECDGFRFDTGPSWWLMPEVFDHFFALLGTSTAEQVELTRLEPGYRVFFEGHPEPVEVSGMLARNRAMFERIEPGAGKALDAYLDSGWQAYHMAVRRFLYTNFDSPAAFTGRDLARHLPTLGKLLGESLERFIGQRFTDRRLRQILGYPAVFLGAAPGRAPAMYHLMSALDLDDGVRYPAGGFVTFIDALVRVATEHGVRLHTSTTVTGLRTRRRPARSLRDRRRAMVAGVTVRAADGTECFLDADVVVGATDLHHFETSLLPPHLQTFPQKYWDRRVSGPGAVLVLAGVRGELPALAHHSLFFTEDWTANFDAIFGSPTRIPEPASVYVCRPSATDPTVAPDGSENLFFLIPVPADPALGRGGVDGSGDALIEQTADRAIAQVAAWAGIDDLAERIVVRRTLGPADFAADLNAWRGGALGPAHTLRQSAFLRTGNRSRTVEGLYYAGSSTRPGIGLPMCLISAELVLKAVRGDRSVGPVG